MLGCDSSLFLLERRRISQQSRFETPTLPDGPPFVSVTISASTAQAHSGTTRAGRTALTRMGISQSLQRADFGSNQQTSRRVRLARHGAL